MRTNRPNDMRCWDCAHFEPFGETPEGECRRKAPSVIVVRTKSEDEASGSRAALWPIVVSDDWCGEFQPGEATT